MILPVYKVCLDVRMLLNTSADWSRGEINVMPDMIQFFWTPDIIIYDLVRSVYVLFTPTMDNIAIHILPC